jgi:hypothetical protein
MKNLQPICGYSLPSKCSPGGSSANFSRCSGRKGSEMACSSLNHLPRSISLQRREQKGPWGPANQSPIRLQVGHLTCIAAKRSIICLRSPNWGSRSSGKMPEARSRYFAAAGLISSVTVFRSAATAADLSAGAPPVVKMDSTSLIIASFWAGGVLALFSRTPIS